MLMLPTIFLLPILVQAQQAQQAVTTVEAQNCLQQVYPVSCSGTYVMHISTSTPRGLYTITFSSESGCTPSVFIPSMSILEPQTTYNGILSATGSGIADDTYYLAIKNVQEAGEKNSMELSWNISTECRGGLTYEERVSITMLVLGIFAVLIFAGAVIFYIRKRRAAHNLNQARMAGITAV